jgi:hypothetical protein
MSQLSFNNAQMINNNGFHANFYGTIQDNNRTSYTIPTYVPSQSNSAWNFAQESIEIGSPIFLGDETENFSSSISNASKKINKAFPASESKQVVHRRNKKARNPWTPKEDQKLMELMKKYGQSWAMISSLMDGRTGKQVRDRFLNKLRPNIKCGDWAQHEDELLVRLCKEIGNRWSLIATHLPGRTEGQVKNRYYSHIKKRLLPDGTYCPNLDSSKPTSENVTSMNSSPVQEEAAFDFSYDLDFNMLNGCEMNYNQTATYNNTKVVAYVTEESDRNTTQLPSPQSGSESSYQADPTDVISYSTSENFFYLPRATSFVVPSIENDNHIDEALNTVTNYYSQPASDVDSFFAGNYESSVSSPSSSSDERMEQLNKRKIFLEMALASTMKELKNL